MNTLRGRLQNPLLFVLLDVFCAGLGMGVPLLCIGLGCVVGWWLARRFRTGVDKTSAVLRRVLIAGAGTSAFTFLMMLAIWGPCVVKLAEPDSALANFGMPMLLFAPRPSFIAWLALMIVISPFLQFLMTLFGSCVMLAWRSDKTYAHS